MPTIESRNEWIETGRNGTNVHSTPLNVCVEFDIWSALKTCVCVCVCLWQCVLEVCINMTTELAGACSVERRTTRWLHQSVVAQSWETASEHLAFHCSIAVRSRSHMHYVYVGMCVRAKVFRCVNATAAAIGVGNIKRVRTVGSYISTSLQKMLRCGSLKHNIAFRYAMHISRCIIRPCTWKLLHFVPKAAWTTVAAALTAECMAHTKIATTLSEAHVWFCAHMYILY